MNNCLNVGAKSSVDQEILSYLETVFKSLSCLNGSFLLPNEEHYYCTSKHHGVDVEVAEKVFSLIGKFENTAIKDIVSHFNSMI